MGLSEFSRITLLLPAVHGRALGKRELIHSLFGTRQEPPLGSLDIQHLAQESSFVYQHEQGLSLHFKSLIACGRGPLLCSKRSLAPDPGWAVPGASLPGGRQGDITWDQNPSTKTSCRRACDWYALLLLHGACPLCCSQHAH